MTNQTNPILVVSKTDSCERCKLGDRLGRPLIPFGTKTPRLFHFDCHGEWIAEQEKLTMLLKKERPNV